jgi:hypothetical protein
MAHHHPSRWEALIERNAASSCANGGLLNRRTNTRAQISLYKVGTRNPCVKSREFQDIRRECIHTLKLVARFGQESLSRCGIGRCAFVE